MLSSFFELAGASRALPMDLISEPTPARVERPSRDAGLFDTPGEEAFGRIVRLTANIFHTPLALIVLADEEHLWSNTDALDTEVAGSLRALCLCSQVAAAGGAFWAENTRRHPLLTEHPLATGAFNLRAFAAAPIVAASNRRVLGTLCLLDHRPRRFTPAQRANLLSLAALAADELELRREARRRGEARTHFDEERLRELFERSPLPMWVFDVETLRFLEVNAAALKQYGYSREEFLTMTIGDIRPEEDLPALRANLARNTGASVGEPWRHRRKDGSVIEVEVSSSELSRTRRPARLAVALDVTHRQDARQALQTRDRYLAALARVQRALLNPGAVNPEGLESVLGELGEVSGAGRVYYLEHHPASQTESLRADWHAPDAPPVRADAPWPGLLAVLPAGRAESLRRGETCVLRADDDTLPAPVRAMFAASGVFSVLLVPLLSGGRFLGVLGFDNRVSEHLAWTGAEADHLQAAAAALALALERETTAHVLADERERQAVMLASVNEGVITTDLHDRVVLMNRVAEELTGHPSSRAAGQPVDDVFSLEEDPAPTPLPDTAPAASLMARALVGSRNVLRDHQVWLWSRDGTRRRIAKSRAPVYDERGEVIGAVRVFRDISEQEKVAGELLKASKLESVGILAGGIAHDFNNILTAIIGNLSLARLHCGEVPRAATKLEAAERACYRARDLTGQLLTFARGGEPIKKLTRLDEVVRESIHFALHGSTVFCHFALAEDLWPVEADPGQIGQVINNLGINAVQAMPRGGIIEVRAENIHLEPGGDAPVGLSPGQYVKICVEDDGTGISPAHLSKIFDPFFTTKDSGTGLGLATSYSIIKKHGGHLGADSVQGVGSIFRIYLPAQPQLPVELERALTGNPPPGPCARSGGGALRVLIMDDEAPVRELAQSMLAYLGHDSVATADGASALETYRQAHGGERPFDLVILDLTVPGGMGGRDTLNQLRKIDPQVKTIVSSGYSNNPIMSDHRGHGFLGMLSKPYRVNELADVLNGIFQAAEVS